MGNKALGTIAVLGIIIGASGLGLGIFSFMNIQANQGSPKTPGVVVVGIWDALYKNKDYAPYNTDQQWLIRVDYILANNSEYFFLNRTDTRFHLIKSGWYRVNLLLTLVSISGTADIYFRAYKNGNTAVAFSIHHNSTIDGDVNTIEGQFYIYSDGSNYYDFYVASAPATSDTAPNQDFNQLGIEYVGDY
ncbi:MAG: hypothetical protein ACFFDF_10655 [Candidatus Odinarchaeota archaeon]